MARSVEDRVKALKRDFVLQVYLGDGPFWHGVRRARIAQGVQAETKLPPPQVSFPSSVTDPTKLQSWRSSVRAAWELVVPRAYRDSSNWDDFAATCILYDPPELHLEEFAQRGESALVGSKRPALLPQGDTSTHRTEPTVEWIDSEGHRANLINEFYQGVITEIGKRYFEPRGEDVWQVVSDIYNTTDLLEKLRTKLTEIEIHPFITVGRDTSDDDIERAVRQIRSIQEKNIGGRPARDKLVAIKCAALYHEHNQRLPEDRRKKRWTYESLAKEIVSAATPGQPIYHPKRVGEEYVKLGESLRRERIRK